jgi:hypothetical protein
VLVRYLDRGRVCQRRRRTRRERRLVGDTTIGERKNGIVVRGMTSIIGCARRLGGTRRLCLADNYCVTHFSFDGGDARPLSLHVIV